MYLEPRTKPKVERLEPRDCPTTISNHGGPIIANPEVSAVFVGSAVSEQPTIDNLTRVLASTAYAGILPTYGVGPGVLAHSVSLANPGPINNAQLQALLTVQLDAGAFGQPDANTLVMVMLPAQVTDSWAQNASGFHSAFWDAHYGMWIPYGVVFVQPNETIPWSHEFAEAVTDPDAATGWFGANTGQEIGDVYNWQAFFFDGFRVTILAGADGSQQIGSGLSVEAALTALPIEAFYADAWGLLALIDPAFRPQAQAADDALNANPLVSDPEGAPYLAEGRQAFELWVSNAVQ